MSKISNDMRKAVYRRDGYQCAVCGDPRRLQVHHIQKRSQGGGNEQINLITLCEKCHALAHGINLADVPFTKEDIEQAIVEYMSDYYADQGFRWPDGEPLDGYEVLPGSVHYIDGPDWFDSPEAEAVAEWFGVSSDSREGSGACPRFLLPWSGAGRERMFWKKLEEQDIAVDRP